MGVPFNQIEYFPARDCEHYVGDAARAVEDAKKEGWEMNPRKAATYLQWSEVERLKWFCMRWTFTMIFKKDWFFRVKSGNET